MLMISHQTKMEEFMRILMVLGALFLAFSAHGEDKSNGCGLGWKVAPQTSLISSYTRGITNFTTSSTSGMTSGTSGCDHHSIVNNDKKDIHFAEANYHSLMIEMAKGQGEFLNGFAMTLGCGPSEASQFAEISQKNYDRLFPAKDSNPIQLLDSVKGTLSESNICGYSQI
jgi:hypothetical protein